MIDIRKVVRAEVLFNGQKMMETEAPVFAKDYFERKNVEIFVIKGENLPVLHIGDSVNVIFYCLNGTRIEYIAGVNISTDMQISMEIHGDGTVLPERRNAFKIQTTLTGSVIMYIREMKNTMFKEKLNIKVHNLSIGGMLFSSVFEFEYFDRVLVTIIKPELVLLAEIIRIEPGDNRFNYGCKFHNLSRLDEGILSRYINQCQLEQRKINDEKRKTRL